jgi:hypothetical protein
MNESTDDWLEESSLYDLNEYRTGEYVASDTHIPSTEAIRATYATDYYMVVVNGRGTPEGRAAAFDRWLAEHDRQLLAADRSE